MSIQKTGVATKVHSMRYATIFGSKGQRLLTAHTKWGQSSCDITIPLHHGDTHTHTDRTTVLHH